MITPLFLAYSSATAGRAVIDAKQAARDARSTKASLNMIKMDIEKLLMITEALWSMLKQEHGYTDEELINKIQQIDLRDGKLDGKVARKPAQPCPGCGRKLIRRQPMCLYCGTVVPIDPFER